MQNGGIVRTHLNNGRIKFTPFFEFVKSESGIFVQVHIPEYLVHALLPFQLGDSVHSNVEKEEEEGAREQQRKWDEEQEHEAEGKPARSREQDKEEKKQDEEQMDVKEAENEHGEG